jgi:acyl-CoA thioester hydrolase
MGYCYYGNYAQYYEVARVETLKSLGISYKKLEDKGVLLPVSDFSIKYILPALYDQELKIRCTFKELTDYKIKFDYQTYNDESKLLNFGNTTLVFVDKETKKPIKDLLINLKP